MRGTTRIFNFNRNLVLHQNLRFIVVCLLLKKMKLVRDLVRELSKQIGWHYSFHLTTKMYCQAQSKIKKNLPIPCTFELELSNVPPQTSTQLRTSPKTNLSGASCWERSARSWRRTRWPTCSTTTATPSSSRTGFHPSSPQPWREAQS